MAKLPAINRITIEDFPDQQKWIGKLLNPLNAFLAGSVFALTRHLTFGDNFLGQEQYLDFIYNGPQILPVLFTVTMNAVPLALYVVSAVENVTKPVALVCAWSTNQAGQVQITDISKLSLGISSALVTGARYQIRIRITP